MDERGRLRQNRVRRKAAEKKFTHRMQSKLIFVFFVGLIGLIAMIGRLVYLNNTDGEKYKKRVLSQQTYQSNAIPFRRGDIVDRNGTLLATSEKVYNMILDPVTMLEKESYKEPTVKALEKYFGIPREEVNKILAEQSDSRYVQMKDYKRISYEKVEPFEKAMEANSLIQGVWFEDEYVREYPLNNVASQIIGFTQEADHNVGNWGIEEYYNDELNGTAGRRYGYIDSELNLEQKVQPAVNGNRIVSTIDTNIQRIVEECIEGYKKKPGAENVAALLMNPNNGEIYAMASNNTFDLNNPRDLSSFFSEKKREAMTTEEMSAELSKIWTNYCISGSFEPGSTFKALTICGALDEGVTNENATFNCDGKEKVADYTIRCVNRSGHGYITLEEALMVSCNDALMELSSKLGRDTFYEYMERFCIGKKTGIDLPGEATGISFSQEELNPVELATSSFGQGNSVTMVQMAAAFSSIINGGNYYTPHVVKEIQNENGATVEKSEGELVRKTVSESTCEIIKEYLYRTVEDGTANPAKVNGYKIGGKTGTAEKSPRGSKKYVVSFLGFTPIENPELVIYVVIDEPNEEEQDHSTYATKLAHKIMKKVLPFLDIK